MMNPRSVQDFQEIRTLKDHNGVYVAQVVNIYTGNYAILKRLSSDTPTVFKLACREELNYKDPSSHPSVIRYHTLETDNVHRYIIMDFFSKGALQNFLHPRLSGDVQSIYHSGTVISKDQVWRYLVQMVDCINWLHNTALICHRDIKSENILLDDDMNIVLMDFDRCNIMSSVFHTKEVSSPLYIPSKVADGIPYTSYIDYYCLGILLYEISTGYFPYLPDRTWLNDGSINVRELLNKQKENKRPDFTRVDPEFKDIIDGLINEEEISRRTFNSLATNPLFLEYSHKYRAPRPIICTVTPWSDCDCLIVSDRHKELWQREEVQQSYGEYAQVLVVNGDQIRLTPHNYKNFLIHLKHFILKRSPPSVGVVFQMTCPQFSMILSSSWETYNQQGNIDCSHQPNAGQMLPVCSNPFTCIALCDQSGSASGHLRQFRHVCPNTDCHKSDPDHWGTFIHLPNLPRCCHAESCLGLQDPHHRFRFYHPLKCFIPKACPAGQQCTLRDRDHLAKFSHWDYNTDAQQGLDVSFGDEFQRNWELLANSKRYSEKLISLFKGVLNEAGIQLFQILLENQYNSINDLLVEYVNTNDKRILISQIPVSDDVFNHLFGLVMRKVNYNSSIRTVMEIVIDILLKPLLSTSKNLHRTQLGVRVLTLRQEMLYGTISSKDLKFFQDFMTEWFHFFKFHPPKALSPKQLELVFIDFSKTFD
ncbi:hypothetical protein GEMRC1_005903 [Eukaryota sp. GEM-RC1]